MNKRQRFFAHTSERGKEHWQLLKNHLRNTAHLARSISVDASIGVLANKDGLI